MRSALHKAEWSALQGLCDRLVQSADVLWAGITEAEAELRWLSFAGAREHAPLEPEPDQRFVQVEGDFPAGTALVELVPPREGRSYLCGIVLPAGLTLVVVPDRSRPGADLAARPVIREALDELQSAPPLPPGGAPPAGSGSSPLGPAHKWAWLTVPGWPRNHS